VATILWPVAINGRITGTRVTDVIDGDTIDALLVEPAAFGLTLTHRPRLRLARINAAKGSGVRGRVATAPARARHSTTWRTPTSGSPPSSPTNTGPSRHLQRHHPRRPAGLRRGVHGRDRARRRDVRVGPHGHRRACGVLGWFGSAAGGPAARGADRVTCTRGGPPRRRRLCGVCDWWSRCRGRAFSAKMWRWLS
jgi:hypothetical protein